eukprot:scaffold302334_cov17-Tisochrysis_lutea.AAC.1
MPAARLLMHISAPKCISHSEWQARLIAYPVCTTVAITSCPLATDKCFPSCHSAFLWADLFPSYAACPSLHLSLLHM